jgi:uncharacterized membrane protein
MDPKSKLGRTLAAVNGVALLTAMGVYFIADFITAVFAFLIVLFLSSYWVKLKHEDEQSSSSDDGSEDHLIISVD